MKNLREYHLVVSYDFKKFGIITPIWRKLKYSPYSKSLKIIKLKYSISHLHIQVSIIITVNAMTDISIFYIIVVALRI